MFIKKQRKSRHSKLITPTYELYEYEAIELLKLVPTGSIDLVITDPPYESLEKHRAIGTL